MRGRRIRGIVGAKIEAAAKDQAIAECLGTIDDCKTVTRHWTHHIQA